MQILALLIYCRRAPPRHHFTSNDGKSLVARARPRPKFLLRCDFAPAAFLAKGDLWPFTLPAPFHAPRRVGHRGRRPRTIARQLPSEFSKNELPPAGAYCATDRAESFLARADVSMTRT